MNRINKTEFKNSLDKNNFTTKGAIIINKINNGETNKTTTSVCSLTNCFIFLLSLETIDNLGKKSVANAVNKKPIY
ncbi:hypothetical protein FLACOL_02712 [Flavobacterium columnare]|uniref:Uncharacterized protein n=1 Tax=Flavobacterium columnare TaxID=996 RepID=A0A2N9PEC8_9FLAO|nr:hypothetical protein FLACOL_02712 [Flavobacterium columnare]